jgi:hypothetical protein
MKNIYFIILFTCGVIHLNAQATKPNQLQSREQNTPGNQNNTTTATLRFSSRLFATKDDLTSVILIIPVDSVVAVLDSDSIYFHVVFDENEGYIFKRDAIINKIPVNTQKAIQPQPTVRETEPVQEQQQNRQSYLENKYGPALAAKLIGGKIWKGMNAEMVSDSWGTAEKINRIISGNVVKEEWIFKNTWLYFENRTLLEWGPVKNK